MSEPRTVLTDIVAEKSTCRITGTIQDETGAALGSSALATLTMTIFAVGGAVVNSQENISILNANQGTVDSSGNFVLTLTPSDNALINTAVDVEAHRIRLDWTYGAAASKTGRHEIDFKVRNLQRLT